MNVSELYQLTIWIAENNKNDVIEKKYQELIDAINNNEALEEQRTSMFSVLKSISFDGLSNEQIKFLKKLNLIENIGNKAVKNIEDVLLKNAIDRKTAVKKISIMFSNAQSGIQKLRSIHVNLMGCIDKEQYELNDEVLMRVRFMGNSSINNVEDFKKLGSLWFDIGRGISMAHGGSPKDIKIIGATRGSVILELALNAVLVSPFMIIIEQGLAITEKVYNIKKLRLEAKIAEMKLDHFDEKITEITDNTIANISEKLFKGLTLNTNNQGDKKAALKKSITKLVDFLGKGGYVDFVMKKELEDEDKPTKLLRKQAIEIKKLEEKILLLEDRGAN